MSVPREGQDLHGRVGRLRPLDEHEWRRFLAGFHGARPAATERLLGLADTSPYAWLAEPLSRVPGVLLDLACGSAPTRDHLTASRWVGVDVSREELASAADRGRGPLVRGDAARMPFAEDTAAGMCAAMSLQVLTPLSTVLEEVRRVLRPGGVLAALVPARLGWSAPVGAWRWLRVLRSAGVLRHRWPNPEACDGAARVLRSHGFVVVADERRVFTLELTGPADAAALLDGLYLPGVSDARLARARRALAPWARRGQRLPLPLRRVVARLPRVAELTFPTPRTDTETGGEGVERPAA